MGVVPGKMVGDADHGKEETLTLTRWYERIDGFLIDAIGSETEDIGDKTCATDESELSMVHEGSSVRIEQGNSIMNIFYLGIRAHA